MAMLEASDTKSHCPPWKGDATYYAIHTKSQIISDAGWSYEDPKAEVEGGIKDHLAFYPQKVAVEQL